MRILIIGQLPKEAGGNYTTGAAKVVHEISKQHIVNVELSVYATNTPEATARKNSVYPNQYIGYKKDAWGVLKDVLFHPIRTLREWRHYRRIDHENPLRYAFYKTNIRRAIKLVNPDLIHVNSIGNVSASRFALEGKYTPILLTCHGIFYRGDANDVKGHDIYQGNLPLCDYYTGLTEESRHEFTDILGVSPEQYTIIPNGVDSSKFFFSEKWRIQIRQQMAVSEDTKVFITVASLQERKGQLAFIKILEQLGIDYQYWLVGLGPDKERIEAFVNNNHLESKVKLLGYRNSDELFKYYSASDIYAHPSWKEGQALSEIEAYSTGLRTMVNTAIQGTLIDNPKSEHYCLVNFESPDIVYINNWINQGKVIERTSKQKYDWANIARRYAVIYEVIINKKR